MIKKILTYSLFVTALMLSACASDISGDDTLDKGSCSPKLTMSTSETATSRAYWQDNTPTGGANAIYHWETSTDEVNTVIYSSAKAQFINWNEDASIFSSLCKVTPWTDDDTNANIESAYGVHSDDYKKLKTGDKVYLFNNAADFETTKSNATCTFNLPSEFAQSTANSLADFKPYTYMYASSELYTVLPTTLVVRPTKFSTPLACLRLIIDNNSSYDYTVKNVKMADGDDTKIFPNQLKLTANASGVTISEPTSKTNYYSSITTKVNGDDGIQISQGTTSTFYMYVLPVNADYSGKTIDFTFDYVAENNKMTTQPSHLYADKLPNSKFEAGKIYNLHFKEMILDVDHITIDDWIEHTVIVGQITVANSECSITDKASTWSTVLNSGHSDSSKISATASDNIKDQLEKCEIRVEGTKVYVDIKAKSSATACTGTVTINDQVSNSMAVINVTIN